MKCARKRRVKRVTAEKNDKFTPEQRAAIDSVGRTIVSASAGSGKTTVMIEKIIRLIESGQSVGEILAVTFTKKAAAQMKEKLCKALIKAINAPETDLARRAELKKQLTEVPNADISTIHSFCSRLIRSHFYAAGVDSAFRVIGGDDAEGTALKNRALDALLEEGYDKKNDGFKHLLSVYWRKKSDNALRRMILETYGKLRDRADYKEYLQRSGKYDESVFKSVCNDLHERLKEKCAYYLAYAREEYAWFAPDGKGASLELAEQLCTALGELLLTRDYFQACAMEKPKFKRRAASNGIPEERAIHIARLAALKDKVAAIYDDELSATLSEKEEAEAFERSGQTARALSETLLAFDEKYEALKTERGVLDYNDLEHKALALLSDAEIAAEMRGKYRYVFVDEYQDVNPVQEALINLLGGENLFLVGDVKQSIYGFRGSRSSYFTQKRKEFEEGDGSNLSMKSNFRSADAVLDAVNKQFTLAMSPRNGSIDYAADSYMERGGRYALNDGRVQIHFLTEEKKTKEESRGVYSVKAHSGKRESEESLTAKTIRHIIDEERKRTWYDADEGVYKRVRYSDIAVLSRKKKGKIAKTVEALIAENVPVVSAAATNICEYSEIKTLIDVLSLLDNAEQDVPLCSALLSAMGDLTADELTQIRLAYPKEYYFRGACKKYALEKKDKLAYKIKKFYEYFETLRRRSCVMDAGELLTALISETRMEARLLSLDNGASCLRRMHRFIEESYAEEPLCVHDFLERLKDLDYKIEFSENGGEDAVKVLTMHSSKGLEYPVVIVDDLGASFRHVERDEVFVEEKYGLAPKAFYERELLKRDTLLRRLHKYREEESAIADELNLYYVALTRAKFALHALFEKPSVLPDVRYAKSFADFTDFSVWSEYVTHDALFDVPKEDRTAFAFDPDTAESKAIMQSFAWRYAYAGCENLPVKSSATALMKKAEYIDDAPFRNEKEEKVFETQENRGETNVEAGLAYHAFLENFDFALLYADGRPVDKETLQARVQDTYAQNPDPLLSVDKLTEILSNPVFYQLSDMRLYKEQQFLVSLPVRDTYAKKEGVDPRLSEIDGAEMLFQGAIDLLAVGETAWIIDYKYSVRDADSLKEHYGKQLDLYRRAVSKICKLPLEKVRCTIVNIYRGFQVDLY